MTPFRVTIMTFKARAILLTLLLTLLPLIGVTLTLEWSLISSSFRVKVPFLLDSITVVFSFTVLLISLRVIIFSTSYIAGDKNLNYFIRIVILFIFSINLLIFSPRLITLILGWDGLGLTSYLLVIYYMNDKSLGAGILTALSNRIGDALLILAASWALIAGHWRFSYFIGVNIFIGASIILTAITKRAQIPFSAWLPAAIAAPTPVSALVHSSTLVTAGVYLLIRFRPSLAELSIFGPTCFYLGALTCAIARLSAIHENDLKKIIALSTLRQLGIIIMSLGAEQPSLAFLHLVSHALFKALLFICAGTIIHLINNNQDIRLIGNIRLIRPITVVMLNTANLSLCGFPFLAGFYSKDAIIEAFLVTSLPIPRAIIIIRRICLSAAYSMRLSITLLWSPIKRHPSQYCSKYTYISYAILILGATSGGAFLTWVLNPLQTPFTPQLLKLFPFLTIMFLFIATFLYNATFFIKYMNRMWFLTFISSNPNNDIIIMRNKVVIYNEITWIEKARGSGTLKTLLNTRKAIQAPRDIDLSIILSGALILILMLMLICPDSLKKASDF